MSVARTTITVVLALALLAGVPSVAANPGSECDRYFVSDLPFIHNPLDTGEVRTCDDDGDGATDTVEFETEQVPAEGYASLTHEEKPRKDGEDDVTTVETRVAPGAPMKPILYHEVKIQDQGSDGKVNRADHKAQVHTRLLKSDYWTMTIDRDGDRLPEVIAFLVCVPSAACVAPPLPVPDVPERVDLPDTVVKVEPIGYVP